MGELSIGPVKTKCVHDLSAARRRADRTFEFALSEHLEGLANARPDEIEEKHYRRAVDRSPTSRSDDLPFETRRASQGLESTLALTEFAGMSRRVDGAQPSAVGTILGVWFLLPLTDRLPVPHEYILPFPLEDEDAPGVPFVSLKFAQVGTRYDPYSEEIHRLFQLSDLGQGLRLPDLRMGPSSRTVAEIFTPAPNLDPSDAPSQLFGRALRALQVVQRAYALAEDAPHRLTTRGTLPPLIPVRVGTVRLPLVPNRPIKPETTELTALRVRGRGTDPTPDGTELDHASLDKLALLVGERLTHPRLWAFGELQQDAQVQFDRLEDYRAAVTTAASAGEALVDQVLMLLLFELGVEPDAASKWFRYSVSHYAKLTGPMKDYLGGPWQRGDGVVGGYLSGLSELRNRVVHAAYSPSHAEAEGALRHLRSLFDHVRERLSDPEVAAKCPRTTMLMCGTEYLEARARFTRRLRDAGAADQDDWYEDFDIWCQQVEMDASSAPY